MRIRLPSQGKLAYRLHAAISVVLFLFLWNADVLHAQSGHADNEKGFVLTETFQGSTSAIGAVTKLDTTVGYKFSSHFEVDAGIPFYFVRPSADSTALGATADNGLGNAYLQLRFGASNAVATFASSLTGSAPTGDAAKGFSTGRVTVDWNNYLEIDVNRLTPFVNLGLANSISDTRFFTKPFTSLGKVAHFEGGAEFRLWHFMNVGASAYADAPFGPQKVYSKLVTQGQSGSSASRQTAGASMGQGRGAFKNQSVTVGGASITQDNGGSVWLDIHPQRAVNLDVGYSRSVEYDLNSLFFSIGLNFGDLIRARH